MLNPLKNHRKGVWWSWGGDGGFVIVIALCVLINRVHGVLP
jgi:hypothetical protein